MDGRADDNRVQPAFGGDTNSALVRGGPEPAHVAASLPRRELVEERFLLQYLFDDGGDGLGPRVLQKDCAHAHAARLDRVVHRRDEFGRLDELLGQAGHDDRIARGLGCHDGDGLAWFGAGLQCQADRRRDGFRLALVQPKDAHLACAAAGRLIDGRDELARQRHQPDGRTDDEPVAVRVDGRLRHAHPRALGAPEFVRPAGTVVEHRLHGARDGAGVRVHHIEHADLDPRDGRRPVVKLRQQKHHLRGLLLGADHEHAPRGRLGHDLQRTARAHDGLFGDAGDGGGERHGVGTHRCEGDQLTLLLLGRLIQTLDDGCRQLDGRGGPGHEQRVRPRLGLDTDRRLLEQVGPIPLIPRHELQDARVGLLLLLEQALDGLSDRGRVGVLEPEGLDGGLLRIERLTIEVGDQLLFDLVEILGGARQHQRVRAAGRDHTDRPASGQIVVRQGADQILRDLRRVGVDKRNHTDDRAPDLCGLTVKHLDQFRRDQLHVLGRGDDERVGRRIRRHVQQTFDARDGEPFLELLLAQPGRQKIGEQARQPLRPGVLQRVHLQRGRGNVGPGVEIEQDLLDRLEHLRRAADDERTADRFGVDGDGGLPALRERAARGEILQRARHRRQVRTLDPVRAHLDVRLPRRIEHLHDLVELGHPLGRGVHDDRIRRAVGANEYLLGLLQVRERSAPRVFGHRRHGEHLVHRPGEVLGACDPEREDADLAILVADAALVELAHDVLDLRQHVLVRRDDQCVGRGVGLDLDRLFRPLVHRPLVVRALQHAGQTRCVGRVQRQDLQRRTIDRLLRVQTPHQRLDDGKLRRRCGHHQRVGRFDRLEDRRGPALDPHRLARRDHLLEEADDVGDLGQAQLDDANLAGGSGLTLELIENLHEASQRVLVADNLE